MTALAIASWQGHAAVVELLLQVPDVDVNIKDEVRSIDALTSHAPL